MFLQCYCMRKMSVRQTIGLRENESASCYHYISSLFVFYNVPANKTNVINLLLGLYTLCFYDYFVNVFRMFFVCILYVSFFVRKCNCSLWCMIAIGLCNNDIFNRIQIHNTDSFRTELAKSVRTLGPKWPRTEVTKVRTGCPVRS